MTKDLARKTTAKLRKFAYCRRVFDDKWAANYANRIAEIVEEAQSCKYRVSPLFRYNDFGNSTHRGFQTIDDYIFFVAILETLAPALSKMRMESGVGPSFVQLPKSIERNLSRRDSSLRPSGYNTQAWIVNLERTLSLNNFPYVLCLDVKSCVANSNREWISQQLRANGAPEWAVESWALGMFAWADHKSTGTIPTPPRTSSPYCFTWLILREVADSLKSQGVCFLLSLDDFRIYCKSPKEAENNARIVKELLREIGLELNETKSSLLERKEFQQLMLAQVKKSRISSWEQSIATFVSIVSGSTIGNKLSNQLISDVSNQYLQSLSKRLVAGHIPILKTVPTWLDGALEQLVSSGDTASDLVTLDALYWRGCQLTSYPQYFTSSLQGLMATDSFFAQTLVEVIMQGKRSGFKSQRTV